MDNQKRRLGAPGVLLAIILTVLVVLFLFLQIASWMTSGITTTTATHITINESFSGNGWFVRNEVVAEGTTSETVKHIVHSGEKVQKNAELAIIYSDENALNASQQIETLDDKIALLNTVLQSSVVYDDTAKMDQLIAAQIEVLAGQAHDGIVSSIADETTTLRQLMLRRSAGSLDSAAVQSEKDALLSQKSQLEQQVEGRSTVIRSPASGYFSEIVDGFESVLTYECFDTIDLATFQSWNEDMVQPEGTTLGKIICDFDWYFIIAAPAEKIEQMEIGDSLKLRFSQLDSDVPVTIYDIKMEDGAEEGLLILQGNVITPDLVTMRRQTVEVIQTSYSGIKIPKSAVSISTSVDSSGNEVQQLGVYILAGNISSFKPIEPIYETDTFYVIQQNTSTDDTGVVVGDEIITQARALEDGKVVT